MNILGISCFYHDAAASLIVDGEIVAAAQEERFTRKKHDAEFPSQAIAYCLAAGKVLPGELDAVAFYDKPLKKFHRLLETYLAVAPKGLRTFLTGMPVWLKEKLWILPRIEEGLRDAGTLGARACYFAGHHESHAASAFFPSPFDQATIITLDGVGEWDTTTIGIGEGSRVQLLKDLHFPHSLGLLYSAFTTFCGFRVNSGEYKLMGLAPYGDGVYADAIRRELIDLKEDGSFRLNMNYFGYLDSLSMTNRRFAKLFGGPPRRPDDRITKRECDLARSIQEVTEEIMLRIARYARRLTGQTNLCLAGGVALNCVANGRLLQEGIFDKIWIQPAAGDAGGAIGAALAVWHHALGKPRSASATGDRMQGSFLGPEYSENEVRAFLDQHRYPYAAIDSASWAQRIAELIAQGNVIALHQGRMEFGPRALGNRSIIGDARVPTMQSRMNLKIKFRESFRPFAPSCLEERAGDYFDLDCPSPYMLLVAAVKESRRLSTDGLEKGSDLIAWVNAARSDVPAITHVDYSARVQTVNAQVNPRFHALLKAFETLTGCPLVINTSFNVRGEPIVCTPEDAYRCFVNTEIDYLCIGNLLLDRRQQPPPGDSVAWRSNFMLD